MNGAPTAMSIVGVVPRSSAAWAGVSRSVGCMAASIASRFVDSCGTCPTRGRGLRVHRTRLSREQCDWTHQSVSNRLRGRCRVHRVPSRQSRHGPRGDSTADALRCSGTRPYRPDERTHQLTGCGLRMSRTTGDGFRTRSEATILGAPRAHLTVAVPEAPDDPSMQRQMGANRTRWSAIGP